MSIQVAVAELEKRKQEILREMQALQSELSRINTGLDALKATAKPKLPGKKLSIEDRVLSLLDDNPDGMTSIEINAVIQTKTLNSLSARLSRMKSTGVLALDGFKWKKA